ncbi:MAG: GIY-YIG nuclease family protein, partial [Thermodesulfovibrionales bacterium]
MVSRDLAEKIAAAPATPGVYVFRNAAGQVIYVGKAKSLKNRLKSYTSRSGGLDARKREMVSSAADLSYIVTANELEALALEANLIKQDRPKYNVVLRDDKNYPYLRIDPGERWPHVEVVRRFKKDGALYFGPYIPASGLHETLSLIRKHFGIRLCKYNLAREMRPCVHY